MPSMNDKELVTVTIPEVDRAVVEHHQTAERAIEGMSPSRRFGAESNLRSWRRLIENVDPTRSNGWAFGGVELSAGATASLPVGALIVVYDVSWARARWYAGRYIKPAVLEGVLYEVAADGLKHLISSTRKRWARDLVGWIVTNRRDIPATTRMSGSTS
jgi:hypothetical protein